VDPVELGHSYCLNGLPVTSEEPVLPCYSWIHDGNYMVQL